jgi:hypothetical protein
MPDCIFLMHDDAISDDKAWGLYLDRLKRRGFSKLSGNGLPVKAEPHRVLPMTYVSARCALICTRRRESLLFHRVNWVTPAFSAPAKQKGAKPVLPL